MASELKLKVKNAPQIGDWMTVGDACAELYYAGRDEKGDLWISPYAPKLMNHYEAAAWAKEQGGALLTRNEGKYLDSIKDKGFLKSIFNRSGSYLGGYVWSAETYPNNNPNSDYAWCQRLSNGCPGDLNRLNKLPVFYVRR
jgi:hypothetical protein